MSRLQKLATLTFMVATLLASTQALGLCAESPFHGSFRNADIFTESWTRFEYTQVCNDVVLNPPQPRAQHVGIVQLHGKCYPTDCKLAPRKAYVHRDGWQYIETDPGKRVYFRMNEADQVVLATKTRQGDNWHYDYLDRSDR